MTQKTQIIDLLLTIRQYYAKMAQREALIRLMKEDQKNNLYDL